MTRSIVLPPKLFAEWLAKGRRLYSEPALLAGFAAEKAAEWAADQQLLRVIDWLRANGPYEGVRNELSIVRLDALATELWKAMRPKPPSLKEQAASELVQLREEMERHGLDVPATPALIRAIESIPDTNES